MIAALGTAYARNQLKKRRKSGISACRDWFPVRPAS